MEVTVERIDEPVPLDLVATMLADLIEQVSGLGAVSSLPEAASPGPRKRSRSVAHVSIRGGVL